MIKIHKVQIRKLWGFPVPLVSHDESYSHVSRSFGQMYLLDTLFIKAIIDFCPSLVSGHKIFLTLRGNHIPTFTSSFFGYIKQLGCPGEAGIPRAYLKIYAIFSKCTFSTFPQSKIFYLIFG